MTRANDVAKTTYIIDSLQSNKGYIKAFSSDEECREWIIENLTPLVTWRYKRRGAKIWEEVTQP